MAESGLSPRSRAITATGLAVCGLIALLDGADAQSLAIAAPLLAKALAIPSASLGLLFSLSALGSAIGYLGGGLLADRWGPRKAVTLAVAVIGIFQLLTAKVDQSALLFGLRFVVSLGLGGAVPGLVTLVGQIAPPRLRHRFQGLLWAFFPLGVLGGGIANGWILDHARWQAIFFVGGAIPLALAAALWAVAPAIVPSSIERRTGPHLARIGLPPGIGPALALTGLVFLFANGAIAVTMNWTPSLLVRADYTPSVGAHALAWNAAGALISMIATGFLVERFRVVSIILAGLAASTVAVLLLAATIASPWPVTAALVILGASLGLSGTTAVFLAGRLFPADRQAGGIGLCMAIGRIGQMLFPGLLGLSLEGGVSSAGAFALTSLLPLGGVVAALVLRRSRHDL